MTFWTTPKGLQRVPARGKVIEYLCTEGTFLLWHNVNDHCTLDMIMEKYKYQELYENLQAIMKKMIKRNLVKVLEKTEEGYILAPTKFLHDYRNAVLSGHWTHGTGPIRYMRARKKYI